MDNISTEVIKSMNPGLLLKLVSYFYCSSVLILINIIPIIHKNIFINSIIKNIFNTNIVLTTSIIYILIIVINLFIGETLFNIFLIIEKIIGFSTDRDNSSHLGARKQPTNPHSINPYSIIIASKNGMKLDIINFSYTNARITSVGIIVSILVQLLLRTYDLQIYIFLIILLLVQLVTIRIVNTARKIMISTYEKIYP